VEVHASSMAQTPPETLLLATEYQEGWMLRRG
jgi:hypothetical protein